jgi:hypothetical protein
MDTGLLTDSNAILKKNKPSWIDALSAASSPRAASASGPPPAA